MRGLPILARLPLHAACALGSLYALLCHIPFTWHNFIADRRYPLAVERFLDLHPWVLLAAVLAACLGALAGPGRHRRLVWLWLVAHAAACAWLAFRPLLPGLGNDGASLAWAFLLWVPGLSLEALLSAAPRPEGWGSDLVDEGQPLLIPSWTAALFVFFAYSAAHLLGARGSGRACELHLALGWSLAGHVLAGSALALSLACLSGAALLTRSPRQACLALIHLAVWLAGAAALKAVALSTVSFSGPASWLYAACVVAGPVLMSFDWHAGQGPDKSGLAWPWAALLAAPLLLAPFAVPRLIKADWGFALASCATVAVWLAAARLAFSTAPLLRRGVLAKLEASRFALRCRRAHSWRTLWAGLAVVALTAAGNAAFTAMDPSFRRLGLHPRRALFGLAAEEPSFRTLKGLLTLPESSGQGTFFQLLQKHTNLPRSTRLALPEVELSTGPAAPGPRPDIFFFVIDSLRPDYLGAYNPKADFTPSFDAFAKESAVFKRAFSPYGGTGLSEPALWAGGMLPHMQYPSPFHPANSLEKLVERRGYRAMVTVDQVLSALLRPSTETVRLDAERVLYKFCDSLSELEDRLASAPPGPVFAYTQPQDLHVSVIEKEGRATVSREYPGFFSAYASRVARLDACFGRFVASLKKSGRWDRSIVIVTADHGDSLGEGGRWGHAYTVYPEVLSVPLLIHLPPSLASGVAWDEDAMALNTDITPSLYALLGPPPAQPAPFFGRSLFRGRSAPAPAPRSEHLVASSYGPVYGLLLEDGRSLYIADSTAYQEYLFRLGDAPAGEAATLEAAPARAFRAAVRRWLGEMDRFYGLRPD